MASSTLTSNIRQQNRTKVIKYLIDNGSASRLELAQDLELSSPTVIQIVKELTMRGLIQSSGEYSSTGGRKAQVLSLAKGGHYAVGVGITKHHVQLALTDLAHNTIASSRQRFPYEDTQEYYFKLGQSICDFLAQNGISEANHNTDSVLGVGFSLPGIVDNEGKYLISSIILDVAGVSTSKFAQYVPYKTAFKKNSHNAALAEAKNSKNNDVVCIFLNDSVGGGAFIDNKIYMGKCLNGAGFGHSTLVPDGEPCYCGKKGCLNAYCSSLVLRESPDYPLSSFFDEMENGNVENQKKWDKYLDYLAIAVANLELTFDCDILLGGEVSGYVEKYRSVFDEKVIRNMLFGIDTSFIKFGKYEKEVFAIGAAFMLIDDVIETTDFLA